MHCHAHKIATLTPIQHTVRVGQLVIQGLPFGGDILHSYIAAKICATSLGIFDGPVQL